MMKVLLEMRPALDGHSGIPQETRLLYRGLAGLPGVEVVGLLQSGNLVIESGLPTRRGAPDPARDASRDIDRLSAVVVSLQQGPASHRFEHLRRRLLQLGGPMAAIAASLVGRHEPLTAFDPTHFKDFVWRGLFAKSLPAEDFEAVTAGQFRIMRWPWSALNALGVASSWFGRAMYPRLDTAGMDVMIAETPYPGRVRRGTRLVVRYHDAIPLTMPHTVKDRGYHRSMHLQALRRNAADGAWFACVSDATRSDLLSVLPEVEKRSVTIPNMVSHHFVPETESAARVPEVIWSRKNRRAPHGGGAPVAPQDIVNGRLNYLLMVSTIEPRKNHLALLDAWEHLRTQDHPHLNLVLVGGIGWDNDAILRRFSPWLERGGLHLLEGVPADDLRLLYRHASVTVAPSFGEGFDFAGVEAMRSRGVVAASDIRVHRDVYADAAAYFSPYAPQELAQLLRELMADEGRPRIEALRRSGDEVAARYLPERVMPQWGEFLRRVVS